MEIDVNALQLLSNGGKEVSLHPCDETETGGTGCDISLCSTTVMFQ